MVFVVALSFNVEIHPCRIAEALEEMEEHLCRHISDFFPFKFSIPDKPRPSSEIECHLAEAVIHRKRESISLDSPLVAQRLSNAFSECNSGVLNSVVFIDIEVSLHMNSEIHISMFGNLLKHVVEESNTRVDVGLSRSVEVQRDVDICFFCRAPDLCNPLTCKKDFTDFIPIKIFIENKRLTTKIPCQLGICAPIAYHIRIG